MVTSLPITHDEAVGLAARAEAALHILDEVEGELGRREGADEARLKAIDVRVMTRALMRKLNELAASLPKKGA